MRGVIFDVDGVLLDSMPLWMHAGELYLTENGRQPEEELGRKLFSMSMAEGAGYLKKRYGLSESVEEICRGVNELVLRYYEKEIPLKEGVLESLQALKARGISMVIATSSDEPVIRAALSRLGVEDYFREIFTCTKVGAGKSDPAIFQAAAAGFFADGEEVDYAHVCVVEDSLYAAETAKKAGFYVLGIFDPSGEADWEKLCALSDESSLVMKKELFQHFSK